MNALEITALRKERKDFVLNIDRLVLPGGCIMGLIGENGAGKSTTIQLILGSLKRDGGTVNVLGTDDVALVKQDLGVVLDEVGFPEFLTAVQIGRVMADIFTNWDQPLFESYLSRLSLPKKKPFKEFSKGMKMKMGIAVALSHHPKLLLLDEATSGLDPVVRDELLDIFADFARDENHSILISSHIVSDLEKICDYIAFLHKGRLMLCEEKDALREGYGIWRGKSEELDALPAAAIYGKRVTSYGTEALVRRDLVPDGLPLGAVSIEELFIFMAKEDRA